MTRARYYEVAWRPGVVWIVDGDGAMSVTNDAEAVVHEVLARNPGCRIIYRDTTGHWDELCHGGKKFIGFGPCPPELLLSTSH